jgi:DNA-binding MarR family transcriptional regulator
MYKVTDCVFICIKFNSCFGLILVFTYTFVPTIIVLLYMTTVLENIQSLALPKKTVINILYTQNLLQDSFNDILKPFEISVEQFNVLRILRGQNGKPANMSLIQERMIAKTSNTTRIVDKLLTKSLVTREICPHNRRKMEVNITPKGLELLLKIDPKVDQFEQKLHVNLSTTEAEMLNQLLEKYRSQP